MSSENPSRRPPLSIEHQKANLPEKSEPVSGEIFTPSDEDPRVLRKFDELPAIVAEFWRKMPVEIRRHILNDEQLLKRTPAQMVADFVAGNPQYRTGAEITAEFNEKYMSDADPGQGRGTHSNPIEKLRDVTPKLSLAEQKRLNDIRTRLLGNK